MKLNSEMAAHWFRLPLTLRRRWWEETDFGKKDAGDKLKREIAAVINPPKEKDDG